MTENNPLENAGPPLTADQIAAMESQLGASLPDDYRQFLLQTNGGKPTKAMFQFDAGPAPRWMAKKWQAKWKPRQEAWIESFHRIDENLAMPDPDAPGTLAFWRAQDWLMLPREALRIATVTRDDVLLLYLSGPRRGEIQVMCTEQIDESEEPTEQTVEAAIHFVAPSFGEFFSALYGSA